MPVVGSDEAEDDGRRPPSRLSQLASATGSVTRAMLTPQGIRGTVIEVAWTATHVAFYPLGLVQERVALGSAHLRLDQLPPAQRGLLSHDVEAASTPIILVHGLIDNRSIFALLRRGLTRRGFDHITTLNHSPLTDDVRSVAQTLGDLIEDLCETSGYERVHVVGHSMGGLIARYYVQRLGGDSRVHTLVTLGTPHGGTVPASFIPLPVVRQLSPSSGLIQELEEPAPGCRTRMLAVWSDLDQLVVPQTNGRITHPDLRARNMMVHGVGHMSLPIDGHVVHEICQTLAHLDQDGSIADAPPTP